jgi:hypothetical protein
MAMEVRNGKNSLTRLIAGIVLIIVSILSLTHCIYWIALALIIGITHITSAVFGFCPMERFLHHVFRLPVKGTD